MSITAGVPNELGFDPEALRAKYRHERDRRIRPDGPGQYQPAEGAFAEDPYAEGDFEREPLQDTVDAVVIGGGFGGLLAAARLRQVGVERIRVVEKGGDFGGTWYWNRYPGIHCDIESYVYLPLLEELGYVPEWKYAPGEEIRRHARAIGRHFGLYRDACFQTAVTGLAWDEEAVDWLVTTDRGDRMRARYVVVSNGTLDRPKLPGIPGIESFGGHLFHTSRWDFGYTGGDADGRLHKLADKRVALIGTGATAIQVVPHLGRDAQQLFVFQRTPSTVDVRDNRRTDPEWAASLTPGWQRRRMNNFLDIVAGGPAVTEDLVADAWTASAHLLHNLTPVEVRDGLTPEDRERLDELADFRKMNAIRARVAEIVQDPETARLLEPWYRYTCKRPTFSDEYLQTFNRPNVTLVDTADHGGVERVTGDSLVVGDRKYEVDCIILATGFQVGRSDVLTGRLPVYGRGGTALLAHWKQGPRTLHGFYSDGFPNLFTMGSVQNAASVNFTHILDQQAIHIAEVVAQAGKRGARWVEPSTSAVDAWVASLGENSEALYKFQAECTPGYYNNEGKPRLRAGYGKGAVAFHALLEHWRDNGGLDDVLVDAE
ncbi:NAD(P)/FAD-dependent oxidoreductase [Amycolatopsis sp. FDAARGOS 1241]|uniref:flavin-containing monooxygenase n=1 Tax=Amycolatopsis sp. FDAARGOS 1241 TaxID=2778070 RepID=UPI001951CE6E|nr:NAD(P)/FAD-dependent oxidoreductase [Amycolatopsis sp. FDAARGOS 1241]QRP47692.1 NAD(P)/FAD-dependent oxidoreductase [Amycolatopsis sp. FDAARGOS 1241]